MLRLRLLILPFTLLALALSPVFAATTKAEPKPELSIGAGTDSRQQLLSELAALLLEKEGFSITIKPGINEADLQPLLANGEIDLCFSILTTAPTEAQKIAAIVHLEPLPFPTGPALLMQSQLAKTNNIKTISQLAKQTEANPNKFRIADTDPANAKRLTATYHLPIASRQPLPPSLLYRTLKTGRADVALGRPDDGRIVAFRLIALTDDRKALPDLHTTPLISKSTHTQYPNIATTLARLNEHLNAEAMQRMHGAVLIAHRTPQAVAKEWLRQNGLL